MINQLITEITGVILGIPHYFDTKTAKGKATPVTVPIVNCNGMRGNGRRLTTFVSVLIKEPSNKVLYDLIEDILAALIGFQNLVFTECTITVGTDGCYAELSFTHSSIIGSDVLMPSLVLGQTTQTFNQNCEG